MKKRDLKIWFKLIIFQLTIIVNDVCFFNKFLELEYDETW